jgi:hypothetical protein
VENWRPSFRGVMVMVQGFMVLRERNSVWIVIRCGWLREGVVGGHVLVGGSGEDGHEVAALGDWGFVSLGVRMGWDGMGCN